MKDERITNKMRGSESLKGVNQEQIKGKKRCRHWIRQDQRLWENWPYKKTPDELVKDLWPFKQWECREKSQKLKQEARMWSYKRQRLETGHVDDCFSWRSFQNKWKRSNSCRMCLPQGEGKAWTWSLKGPFTSKRKLDFHKKKKKRESTDVHKNKSSKEKMIVSEKQPWSASGFSSVTLNVPTLLKGL